MNRIHLDFRRPRKCWKDDAYNPEEFRAWDRAMRKKYGYFAGVGWFRRTDREGYRSLSRHWPHMLCWSWQLWIGVDTPQFQVHVNRYYRFINLDLAWARLRLSWQDYGWMAKKNMGAPEVRWHHHLLHMNSQGTA